MFLDFRLLSGSDNCVHLEAAWLRGHDAIAFVSASQKHTFQASKRNQS
jgi:hypothetical protein